MPAEMGINMNYAEIKYCDIANGPDRKSTRLNSSHRT